MALHSHILIMAVFAICVGTVSGVLLKDDPREQLRTGGTIAGRPGRRGLRDRVAALPLSPVTSLS